LHDRLRLLLSHLPKHAFICLPAPFDLVDHSLLIVACHYFSYDPVLHLSDSHQALLRQLAGAFLEELELALCPARVRLLNEIDEALCPNEPLKERLVLSHVLDVVIKVKDVVGAIALGGFLCVEVLKGIDQKDEEVEELLLYLQSEGLPCDFQLLFLGLC